MRSEERERINPLRNTHNKQCKCQKCKEKRRKERGSAGKSLQGFKFGNNMAEQKWILSSIIGAIILISAGAYVFYNSDYKYILASMPDKDIFILKYDSGDKVEIVTRSSVCDYALFRVTKDELTAKCGYKKILDAKYFLEYFKTYGADEWARLDRKAGKITLDVSEEPDGFIVKKVTPYYATKSRTGDAGNLIETYKVTKDSVKSSIEFQTPYTSRDWRVIWSTIPNVEVVEDQTEYLKLAKNLNVYFSDALFDYRIDNDAFYKVQQGSFRIDPLLQFGNFTGSATIGTFAHGFCIDCQNEKNVSFLPNSTAFLAVYESGWEFSEPLMKPDNLSYGCNDAVGGGYCEISIRNGSEIIPTNDSTTITRCVFNLSTSCFDGRSAVGSGNTFNGSALNNYDGILIDASDTVYLGINSSSENETVFTAARITNYTLNFSEGTIDMMVTFR